MRLRYIGNNVYICQDSGQVVTYLSRNSETKEVVLLMQNGGTRKYHEDELIIEDM